jgi:hypothetical protein
MISRTLKLGAAAALITAAGSALADHNSKWGEGWANMPNDVHNTRIDTRGDNEAFRDFVRHGNGADSVNRFDTGDRGRRMSGGAGKDQARMGGSGRGPSTTGGRGR